MNIEQTQNISHECPYCMAKCQFTSYAPNTSGCKEDGGLRHEPYGCIVCGGIIIIKWNQDSSIYHSSIPLINGYKPTVNLERITSSKKVKDDFLEAINCYNNGSYNASMMMSRRAIQQEVIDRKAEGNNLYEKIEALGISPNLKKLLQKIKNFGNYGAHPDFCLYDKEGQPIEDEKGCAELSLRFLDKYLGDQESDLLADEAPKSEKEL